MNGIRGGRKNDEMYNPYNGKGFLIIKGNEAI